MEEQKLNFNAPLLSVRRFSGASSFSDRDKLKKVENCSAVRPQNLPFYNSEVSLDQVTEPVAVPFIWEQIPGKAKGGNIEHLSWSMKEIIKYPVEEVKIQNVVRSQIETCFVNDNLTKLDCSNEGMNEKCSSKSDNDDAYSDALDTLSHTDSFSMNCSVSDLSGSGGGSVLKRSGTFSTDQLTRDFMMSRFLPAAKAMTLETPQYASRKQSVAPEQPREVKEVVIGDRKPPANRYESIIIPHYNQDEDEDDMEDEYDNYEDAGNLSRKAYGLLPRLCLNPVPGLKVRTRSSMSSTHEIAKPSKAKYIKSHSQIVKKQAWNAVQKNRSNSVPSLRLPWNEIYSSAESPRLEESKAHSGVQSPKLTCGPNRFSNSGDQHIANTSPPKRLPGGGQISPYRRERPQSPFRGGGFLGMPKKAEKCKSNIMVKYTRQGSGSLSPAVEKTLYVDTLNIAEISSSNSDSSGAKFQMESEENHSDTFVTNRMLEETSYESSQVIQHPSLSDGKGISENEVTKSSFSDIPSAGSQVETLDCFRQNNGLNQESKSLRLIKVRADKHLTTNDSSATDQGDTEDGSDFSPLPPPLPRTPSESWLWRALPTVTSRNSFLQSYSFTRFNPRKQKPKQEPPNETKWETIVKTTYFHRDHVRYSEELVNHFSQQSKTL